jgi:hypothetical protein
MQNGLSALRINTQSLYFQNHLLKTVSPSSTLTSSSALTPSTFTASPALSESREPIDYPSMVQEAIASLTRGQADCTNLNILVRHFLVKGNEPGVSLTSIELCTTQLILLDIHYHPLGLFLLSSVRTRHCKKVEHYMLEPIKWFFKVEVCFTKHTTDPEHSYEWIVAII